MGKLGHYAFRRRKLLAIGSVVFAIVAAVGGSTVYDNVKPFGFQDPNSDSARAYDALRDATGERPIPEVELLVAPTSGRPLPDAQRAALELRSVNGIQRVITPEDDPALVSTDGRVALVLGFISSDVDDISEIGTDVKNRFSGDPGIEVGGAAVTVDELTSTTQDDLKRIELFALPLLLLLSFLIFRGLVAAVLPRGGRSPLDPHDPAPPQRPHHGRRHRHLRDQHRHGTGPRARNRLQPVPGDTLQGGARPAGARSRPRWPRPPRQSAA